MRGRFNGNYSQGTNSFMVILRLIVVFIYLNNSSRNKCCYTRLSASHSRTTLRFGNQRVILKECVPYLLFVYCNSVYTDPLLLLVFVFALPETWILRHRTFFLTLILFQNFVRSFKHSFGTNLLTSRGNKDEWQIDPCFSKISTYILTQR